MSPGREESQRAVLSGAEEDACGGYSTDAQVWRGEVTELGRSRGFGTAKVGDLGLGSVPAVWPGRPEALQAPLISCQFLDNVKELAFQRLARLTGNGEEWPRANSCR